jgi:hypothetical protein
MQAHEMLLHLACVLSSRGVALPAALLCSAGHAAYAVGGGTRFALGAAGVGLHGWHAVKRLQVGGWSKACYGRGVTQRPGRSPAGRLKAIRMRTCASSVWPIRGGAGDLAIRASRLSGLREEQPIPPPGGAALGRPGATVGRRPRSQPRRAPSRRCKKTVPDQPV